MQILVRKVMEVMKMSRRKRSHKGLIWFIVFVVLIATAGVVGYFVWDGYFRDNGEETKGVEVKKNETVKKDVETKVQKVEENKVEAEVEKNVGDDGKEVIVQYEGENPNESGGISGVVTYAEVSSGQLVIRVNIDQYLAGGSCTLALRNGGGLVYSDTAEIMDAASTATCAGFNVPLDGLPSGNTVIVISVTSGEKSGEIRGEVEL